MIDALGFKVDPVDLWEDVIDCEAPIFEDVGEVVS